MNDNVPEQYRPRLSHVVKWKDFQGYGFNLHAEKGKAGQFIGKVDEHSPAEAAGLKEGDRIVEVNGINIGNENHQQVVTRIKSGGEETRLLVVDSEADGWYKEHKMIVKGDSPEVRFISAKREDEDEPTDHGHSHNEHHNEKRDNDSHHEREAEVHVSNSVSTHVQNGNGISEDYSHRPRLCHLKLWPHFQGYGFNLHAERDKPGQYIGLVDDDSPASSAGMKVHDRIIEVNGVNVEQEKHTEVIARIKAIPGEAKLLVADRDTDVYYKEKGVTMSSSMPQTDYIVTKDPTDVPEKKPEVDKVPKLESSTEVSQVSDHNELVEKDQANETQQEVESNQTSVDNNEDATEKKSEEVDKEEETKQPEPPVDSSEEESVVVASSSSAEEKKEAKSEDTVNGGLRSQSQLPEPSETEHEFTVAPPQIHPEAAAVSAPSSKGSGDLELNLSVAEMKERLKANKKQDPRQNRVTFEQKFKEFQRM